MITKEQIQAMGNIVDSLICVKCHSVYYPYRLKLCIKTGSPYVEKDDEELELPDYNTVINTGKCKCGGELVCEAYE